MPFELDRKICPQCLRSFERRDSLLRHMRVHNEHRILKRRKRTACLSCSKSKIKCTGEQPSCRSCSKRQIPCVYGANNGPPFAAQQKLDASEDSLIGSEQQRPQAHVPSAQPVIVQPSRESLDRQNESLPDASLVLDDVLVAKSVDNALPTDNVMASMPGVFESGFGNLFDATDFHSNLDWLFETMSGDDSAGVADFYMPNDVVNNFNQTQVPDDRSPASPSSQEPHQNDNETLNDRTSPSEGDQAIPDLPSIPHCEDSCGPDDPWPMEYHAVHSQRSLELPELGADGEETSQFFSHFFSSWALQPSTVDALTHYMQLPTQRSPWQAVWPLIHQPSFDPDQDPTVTLAVASVGALYSPWSAAKAFSNAMSEINRRLLLFLAEYDCRYTRTESYLTAQLLQGLHGYCSGNKRLFELSESFRNNLIHHAKCMGLFRQRPDNDPGGTLGRSAEERWSDWIHQERLCRLGWAVYKYDASVAYLHNNRPFLSIGDMHLDLPCEADLWKAESAHCWLSMLPPSQMVPKSPRLRPLMRTLFDKTPKPTAKIREEEHRYTLVLTLVRMIWTCKEIKSSPVTDLIEDGPTYYVQPLLDAIDGFTQSARRLASRLTTTELARAMHTQQVIHVAHLYGAGGLMTWLYPLLRGGNEATLALAQLDHWATESPDVVRDAAYHAAQILSLARAYPSNSPNESFLIFQAGTALFYLGKLLVEHDYAAGGLETPRIVRLDYIERDEDDDELVRTKTWLRTGQAHQISLQGIPSLSCDEGRRKVLDETVVLLRRRHTSGISESFVKVVLRLRDTLRP
ncbi:hypothetical protein PV08_03963 [Exophiala spinifera]|uniref:Zn(2)-C6 fungal-type domain-containing protein n=1 Tax=Exophiala spinifera TaxID=91928 RepID=A0A0D2BCS2_9EURO|nr:uncharacterized protein PV08_03963 [Exophiala spinifera]KIW16773.1 hypothetical protein PV08_03963 [Exophiala spinifera]